MENRSETHRSPPDAYDGAQLSSALTTSYANPCPPGSAGINNLPTEILAEILLFCVITIDNTTWDDSRFGLVCLRTLRSVCARWDETILGNHNFWTHIDIRVESPLAVRLKLLRSGALPLTIRYFNTEGIGDSGGGNPEFSAIMDLVGSHIHRWKSISFWALDHELEQMTHYLQTSPLPEMEYLKMGRNSVSPDLLAWTLASAPKLRTVVLDGQALPKNCSEFRSLVHIEIEGAIGNLGLLVEAIQASHSLETLSLTDTIFDDNDVAEQQRIGWPDESRPPVLPRLRDIFISGFQSPAAIGCVLRSIRAPNVTALRIFETRSRVYQAGSEVTRAITTYHGDESILVSMLRNTSPLAKLELRCYGEVMDLELDDRDRDLVCRLELSVLHMGTNWMQSAEMIAAVVRDVDVTLRLKFGKPPHATIASFLVTFSMTKELDFTSPDMPVEYVLRYVSVLSRPYNVGGNANMWICPQLAELRLPGEKPEADIMAIAEACLVAKHARRDFNNRSTREGDGGPARPEPQIANLSERSIIQGSLGMENRSETHRSAPDAYAEAQLSSALNTSYEDPSSAGINDLPTEILAQILLFCVIKIDMTTWDDSRFGLVRLRPLRSVCARWNETILGDPKFWTHIDIRVESSLAVRLKLQRSGALPLTIRYFNTEGIDDSVKRNPEFSPIMDLFGSQTHRWQSISFWALDHELESLTHCLQTSPLPEMEYLKIRRNSISSNLLAWTLASAPKLRTVVWDGQALPWNCSEIRSLVHINIEGAIDYLDLLVDVIQASQSLETLSLTDTVFNDDDVAEQQRIGWPDESHPPVLPRLRDINIIGFQSPAAIGCVLRSIRAPNVTTLRMFETHSGVHQAGDEVVRAITTYHGEESILASMLRNTSPLAKLELRCSGEVMGLELVDPDRDLFCRLEFSLLRADWPESAAMIAAVLRDVDVTLSLKFGKLPYTTTAAFLVLFSMTKELEFISPDMPVEDILRYLHILSQPTTLSGGVNVWICPQLAELRLPVEKPAADIMAIAEACLVVKHARRDFNNRSTREGDGGGSDEVLAGIRVTVGGLEFERE